MFTFDVSNNKFANLLSIRLDRIQAAVVAINGLPVPRLSSLLSRIIQKLHVPVRVMCYYSTFVSCSFADKLIYRIVGDEDV